MSAALWRLFVVGVLLVGCPAQPAPPTPLDARALLERVAAEVAAGRAAEVVEPLRTHLLAAPDDALARAALAHALLLGGDLTGSIVQGKLAMGLEPAFPAAAFNLACAYTRAGAPDPAIRWLQVAFATGAFGRADLLADPDLAPLRDDHRVAVYFATGVLSRAEEDAVAVVDRERVGVGETLRLSVALMQLNRPLLSEASARLERGGDAGLPAFDLRERAETFTRGSVGDREYLARTVHFTLRARLPGPLRLGPFVVAADGVEHRTAPLFVLVEGTAPDPASGDAGDLFGFPSVLDGALMRAVEDAPLALGPAAGPVEANSALAGSVVEATSRHVALVSGGSARLVRFRALSAEVALPGPPQPLDALRSSFLRRGTEGPSWVLDVWPPRRAD